MIHQSRGMADALLHRGTISVLMGTGGAGTTRHSVPGYSCHLGNLIGSSDVDLECRYLVFGNTATILLLLSLGAIETTISILNLPKPSKLWVVKLLI